MVARRADGRSRPRSRRPTTPDGTTSVATGRARVTRAVAPTASGPVPPGAPGSRPPSSQPSPAAGGTTSSDSARLRRTPVVTPPPRARSSTNSVRRRRTVNAAASTTSPASVANTPAPMTASRVRAEVDRPTELAQRDVDPLGQLRAGAGAGPRQPLHPVDELVDAPGVDAVGAEPVPPGERHRPVLDGLPVQRGDGDQPDQDERLAVPLRLGHLQHRGQRVPTAVGGVDGAGTTRPRSAGSADVPRRVGRAGAGCRPAARAGRRCRRPGPPAPGRRRRPPRPASVPRPGCPPPRPRAWRAGRGAPGSCPGPGRGR